MDFFQHQDDARKRTGLLVFLFGLAVLTIAALVSVVVVVGIQFGTENQQLTTKEVVEFGVLSFGGVCIVVTLVVMLRLHDLEQRGGKNIAEKLGGKLVASNIVDPSLRQLLNVVEEMAIAAGMPVPSVYVLHDEDGINAFAAGMSIDDAVIGVTQGALDSFNREELQGVIAHEFSHILNGDMRLNTRMAGILFGITCIAHLGYLMMDHGSYSSRRISRSSTGSSKDTVAVVAIGLAFIILGSVGRFFGNLIKAAISRQKEYLADASAVQFTRNNNGIASALKKIATHSSHSVLKSKASQEFSHMMFGQIKPSAWFASHPPIEERIRRIEPGFNGNFHQETKRSTSNLDSDAVFGFSGSMEAEPGSVQVDGDNIIGNIPVPLRDIARDPYSARFIPLILIFDGSETQQQFIRALLPEEMKSSYLPWLKKPLSAALRLPLLELSVPALKALSEAQLAELINVLTQQAEMDNHYSLQEWCVINLVEKLAGQNQVKTYQHKSLRQVEFSVIWLLSQLAWVSHATADEADQAFAVAMGHLGWKGKTLENKPANWQVTKKALESLTQLKMASRKSILEACRLAIEMDDKTTVSEAELYHVIACFLETPLTPVTVNVTN
ncbi:M48 family metallopeptidase [Vibrio sp.]|uniref:M48 family metallopeptidase n=1 Tax=Vibrio sp. TaxID=678 RepID=UPI003D0AD782